METKITEAEILEIAKTNGAQYANYLLLLGAPDWYDGDYRRYADMLNELFEAAR